MGCGASAAAGDKYKAGAPAATAGQASQDAKSTKPETTAKEPPPEKPPEAAKLPEEGAEEAKPAPAAEEKRPPAGVAKAEEEEALAAKAPPAEAKEPAAQVSPKAASGTPVASEPAPSMTAENVVAEAEAALAGALSPSGASPQPGPLPEASQADDEAHSFGSEDEDPQFQVRGGRLTSQSALMELDRSSGARLGISVRGAETVLLVTQVEKEGLMATWNAENRDRVVFAGNRIIQVNGLCGFADQMLEELRKDIPLRIEVDRTDREVKASLSSDGMAHWCRDQIQQMYERHDEAGLKTLDRRMNTYKDRELALYRTLSKKFGEEPKDPEQCHNPVEDIVL